MAKRKASRVAFVFAVVTALTITAVVLYSLVADWSWFQGVLLIVGTLVVVWTITFSFLEVSRIAARSKSIIGPADMIDPDGPREVTVNPPTAEATPHHEFYPESRGQDQGQLTSRLSGTPTPRELFRWCRGKKVS
jgi:hypothetical protein